MNPRQFEQLVCEHFRKRGYQAETTTYSNDYGVDVFATKGAEKIAVQAKMYGDTKRKINRKMVMELHGAKDYFDCTEAVIATNGSLLSDAKEVADKLGIQVLFIDNKHESPPAEPTANGTTFEEIWENYIIPLQGKTLSGKNGNTNQIIRVDWSGIERITSNGRKGAIQIEIFEFAVNALLTQGFITRDEINQNYVGRASSGIVLVLSQVPFFEQTVRPTGLHMANLCSPIQAGTPVTIG